MIHIDEYRLALVILRDPAQYHATTLEQFSLRKLVAAYEAGDAFPEEYHEITRYMMRAISRASEDQAP